MASTSSRSWLMEWGIQTIQSLGKVGVWSELQAKQVKDADLQEVAVDSTVYAPMPAQRERP